MSSTEFWSSLEGLVTRAKLVAQTFVWGLWNGHARIIAVAGEGEIEWVTAGDAMVCDLCSDNEGTYTTEEADILDEIPIHPNCRCELLPVE